MFGNAHLPRMAAAPDASHELEERGAGAHPSWADRLWRAPDVALAAALALAAAIAFALLPGGGALRVALVVPVLLVVPGYLLIQALVVPPASGRRRALHSLLAVGVSPGVVGLLALSTALVPGGFRPVPIVVVVTVACLVLAAVALYRRSLGPRHASAAEAGIEHTA